MQRAIKLLSFYSTLTEKERLSHLKSYPFYGKAPEEDYIYKDKDVVKLARSFCRHFSTPLPDWCRRLTRREFVEDLLVNGLHCRISVDNAVELAIAQAGEDFRDQTDMVLLLAPWRLVAEKVMKRTNVWVKIPPVFDSHPNLTHPLACDSNRHRHQKHERLIFIEDATTCRDAMVEFDGPFTVVYFVENKDPRITPLGPTVVVVKTPHSRPYAVFIDKIDATVMSEFLQHLSQYPILYSGKKELFYLLSRFNIEVSDVQISGYRHTAQQLQVGGTSNITLCSWTWGLDFCSATSRDWMTEPLTETQSYHLAYCIEMHTEACLKIGLDRFEMHTAEKSARVSL